MLRRFPIYWRVKLEQQFKMADIETLYNEALILLQELISIPSYSREETSTANAIEKFFSKQTIPVNRHLNNVWAVNQYFDPQKPTLLLNSHHDTVKPNAGYTKDPFAPFIEADKLFGLGSNDAGASLVSLIAAFIHYYPQQHLKYNIVLAATAEEEISGLNGIAALIPLIPSPAFAIVGEPTLLNLAIAERGLLVIDASTKGIAGHAAREEGDNALYKAIEDIQWIRQYQFDRVSEWLGPVKMTVTSFHTDNKQHNVVPATADFIIDIRVNELYSFDEILTILSANLRSEFAPRSTRLKSTGIPVDHPIVQAGINLGKTCYGSLTTSDKALMPFPALKVGPGDSARSHTADEFVYLHEIKNGIEFYIKLLKQVL